MEFTNSVENSITHSNYELSVTLNGRTYKFKPNLSARKERSHLIWEKLK
jgi:hypothetical protein